MGIEKGSGISMDKFGSYFASIMHKKMGLNTLQDTKKKQQIPSKDNFWPVSDRTQLINVNYNINHVTTDCGRAVCLCVCTHMQSTVDFS